MDGCSASKRVEMYYACRCSRWSVRGSDRGGGGIKKEWEREREFLFV